MALPLSQMEYGRQYEISFKDKPDRLEVEVVDPVRGEYGIPIRVLKDAVFNGLRFKKGDRERLDPNPKVGFRATFLRSGKPIAKFSIEELLAKPTNLWRAEIGKEYAFHLPGSSLKGNVLDPKKIFFATLLEREEKDTLFSDGRVDLKVKVDPEFAKAWGLDNPVLEWKTIVPPRMWEVPAKHAFARNLILLNESAEPEFKLPLEMLGEIRKFQDPTWKPGAWPESYNAGRPGAASNAGRMGGTRRRFRSKKTRRRNGFT